SRFTPSSLFPQPGTPVASSGLNFFVAVLQINLNSTRKCTFMVRFRRSVAVASWLLLPTSKRSAYETRHTTDPGATLSDPSLVENGAALQGDRLHCGGSPFHHQPRGPAKSRLPGLSPATSPPVDADPATHQ